jgi:hypothetical protein
MARKRFTSACLQSLAAAKKTRNSSASFNQNAELLKHFLQKITNACVEFPRI